MHKLFLDGGSCFSSPCINDEERTLYCATLRGRVVAVDLVRMACILLHGLELKFHY